MFFERFQKEYLEFLQSPFVSMFTDDEIKLRRNYWVDQVLLLKKMERKEKFFDPMQLFLTRQKNGMDNFEALVSFFHMLFLQHQQEKKAKSSTPTQLALTLPLSPPPSPFSPSPLKKRRERVTVVSPTQQKRTLFYNFKLFILETICKLCMYKMQENPGIVFSKSALALTSTLFRKSPAHALFFCMASLQQKRKDTITCYGITFRKSLYRFIASNKNFIFKFLMCIDTSPAYLYGPLFEFCLPGLTFNRDNHSRVVDLYFDVFIK
jgi:hypothetical protein